MLKQLSTFLWQPEAVTPSNLMKMTTNLTVKPLAMIPPPGVVFPMRNICLSVNLSILLRSIPLPLMYNNIQYQSYIKGKGICSNLSNTKTEYI